MWCKTYRKKISHLAAEHVWAVWSDVNQWHMWQDDIDYAELLGEFKAGSCFSFKPKGADKILLELVEVIDGQLFTDLVRFPLAKMYDKHEIIRHSDGIELVSTIKVEGLLSFVWVKLVAEQIASGLEQQMERLILRVQDVYSTNNNDR